MHRAGFTAHAQRWDRAPSVDIGSDWDGYFSGRAKKWRHNVRRCGRRLAERGTVSLTRYRPKGATHGDADPRWDLYDQCVAIARDSWQGSSTSGTTLSHDSVAAYFRDVHLAATRAGSLDLNLLRLDGQAIAFIYNYHYQGQVYAVRQGFDRRFASLRPGTVLQNMVLQGSFRRGDCRYDLGVGSLDAKRHWQTSIATSFRYTHFPTDCARAQLLRVKRWFQAKLYGPQAVACTEPSWAGAPSC
jgi:CelD/BcsL family acetyltransferase involved in cellulose biosynthesis